MPMTPDLIAFTAADRTNKQTGEVKTKWREIGAVFAIKDGGFKILLDALPANGEIVLMKPKPGKEKA